MIVNEGELIYRVNDKPPFPKLLLLGLQHVTLMSVYLVIIVIVVRACHLNQTAEIDAVRMGMLALALATTIQALRPPFGSGYLAAPVVSAIYLKASMLAASAGGLPLVLGMTIFAGLFEILLSNFLYRLRALFPPGISGFIISIVGIELGLEGLSQFLGIAKPGNADLSKHLFIAALTLSTMIALSVWWQGIVRLMCSFIGLMIGFVAALLLGAIGAERLAAIAEAPYFALPWLHGLSYQFSFSLLVPFFVASIAAALRTIGVITTCQKINDTAWKRPNYPSIKGGVFADGVGCTLAGLMGIPGISTGPSLVGVAKASGATSRMIAFAASGILVIFAFFPKIAALFLIMPMSVIGPALMFTGSFMIVGGIQVMTSRNIDTRMTYIIGFAFLFGLSKELYPAFYASLPNIWQVLASTSLSLSVVIALALNLIFRIGIKREASIIVEKNYQLSDEELRDFLIKRGNAWHVQADIIERSVSTTLQIMQHLRQTHLVQGKIHVMLSFDEVDFVVRVHYRGDLLSLPFANQHKTVFLEEESFSYGLADFLTGVYADRFEQRMVKDEANIYLYFAV